METKRRNAFVRMQTALTETFGLSRLVAGLLTVVFCLVVASVIVWFIGSAPPRKLVVTSGPAGSPFQRNAERYARILAQQGVTLEIRNHASSRPGGGLRQCCPADGLRGGDRRG